MLGNDARAYAPTPSHHDAPGKSAPTTARQKKPLIAVVDDDATIRRSLDRLLRAHGCDAITFGSGCEFLESVAAAPVALHCVVLDMQMPGLDGLEVQRRLRLLRCELPVIFLSARYNSRAREAALRGGALAYFTKPLLHDTAVFIHLIAGVAGDMGR
ncbi:MAG TPA: response regulator [Burkholderiales bacterium]|nr:response regulator [Burkholderiales bacterium]